MILAIDQGTTGTTCLVFDHEAELVGRAYREFTQHFPRPGWVEHDAAEIWAVTRAVAGEALQDADCAVGELQAVGITNQRETVCVWDPHTGEPLHHAIVWQDRRGAARCDELRLQGHESLIRTRTGLVLDPYFSGTKIEWLLDQVPGLRERAREGRAVFGTVDSWIIFKLTGEHVTEPSNASRTLLFDIAKGAWDPELLALFGDVPARALQELERIVSSGTTPETIEIGVRANQVVFRAGDVVLSSRLIDGQFPNYRQLLPETYEHELSIAGDELIGVVRRISLMAQKNAPLRLSFSEGELTISAQTPDVGEASEPMPVPFSGEAFEIGFNPDFLRDGLESVESGDVVLKLISPLRPGLIEAGDGSGFLYLIMPIRLNV